MEPKPSSGETQIPYIEWNIDKTKIVNNMLYILNRLGIPFKNCWSSIYWSGGTYVIYTHTDINF